MCFNSIYIIFISNMLIPPKHTDISDTRTLRMHYNIKEVCLILQMEIIRWDILS
ncbi:hypothetical protein VP193E371_P0159 [Vibrio phage 193E37-1]|nr:hypothetical protein VP495E541_P0157 [Vibrio phage 495E54-1]CAH9014107.1 hypothetical protein VP496E541_P0158 [Vibrio phage 496E54-1]CAH9017216.1 hypothetical protein VP193E371_P0159 [Vibrio phage 193E37-1]